MRLREGGSDVGSTLKVRGHGRRPSVTFEDMPEKGRERVRERAKSEAAEDERRNRRRSEAKAAIEVCHGLVLCMEQRLTFVSIVW